MNKILNIAIIGVNRGNLLIDYSKIITYINIIAVCDIDFAKLNFVKEPIFKTNNYQEI